MRLIRNRQRPVISQKRASGFSLIELMIALAVGLVVAGGAISLSVSHIRNNALVVSSTRLTQESRAMREIISREVRRARLNGTAIRNIGAGTTATTFDVLATPSADCIHYAYDADLDGVADPGEFRSLSLNNAGQLILGRFDSVADIASAAGTALNSPEVVISSLNFVISGNLVRIRLQTRLAADNTVTRDGFLTVRVRSARVI